MNARDFLVRRIGYHHAEDRGVALHRGARVDFDRATIADDHDAAVRGNNREIFPQVYVREHFQNDVGPAPIGQRGDFFQVIGRMVVEHIDGALFLDQVLTATAAGGADDAEAAGERELDGGDADTTAGAMNENRLAGFGLGFSVRTEITKWDPAGRVGEYGWGGAASTHYWVSPADKMIVITLEQIMPYQWDTEFGVKKILYDARRPSISLFQISERRLPAWMELQMNCRLGSDMVVTGQR